MTSVIHVEGVIVCTVHKIIFYTKQSNKNIQHDNVNLRVLTMSIISSSFFYYYWLSMLHYNWVILHAISYIVGYHGVVL